MRAVCTDLRYDEVCILYDGVWPGKFNKADARIGPDTRPTRKNMLAAMAWLVKDAAAGDLLWLHYSGHGGQLRALIDGTEPNNLNDTIVPVDYEASGQIRDEDLKKILVEPIRGTGASLRAVLDSCHSGTGIDLKYNLVDATLLRTFEADAVNAFARGGGAAIIAPLVAPLIPSHGDRALAVELAGPETLIEWSGKCARACGRRSRCRSAARPPGCLHWWLPSWFPDGRSIQGGQKSGRGARAPLAGAACALTACRAGTRARRCARTAPSRARTGP